MRTNLYGPLNITRAILPKLRSKGKGTLVYLSSQAAWHADPSASAYCASKFALAGTYFVVMKSPVSSCLAPDEEAPPVLPSSTPVRLTSSLIPQSTAEICDTGKAEMAF